MSSTENRLAKIREGGGVHPYRGRFLSRFSPNNFCFSTSANFNDALLSKGSPKTGRGVLFNTETRKF